MTDRVFVVPADGMTIPDIEAGDNFPPEGRETSLTLYVHRRIADGGLVRGKPARPAAAPAAPATEKTKEK